ncbi:MAG: GNAT family N-acetyltransferase [Hyphomicrobiaceae bacterium]
MTSGLVIPPRSEPLVDLDLAAFLDLNNRHKVELSELDATELARLVSIAFQARGTRNPMSMLLAYDQLADYASPNFLWFKARFERFVYIDRVVVSVDGRGLGLASRLYADLVEAACSVGHTRIVAEVNSDPPNPASDAFHAVRGFTEVGRAHLGDRGKTVRYLCQSL